MNLTSDQSKQLDSIRGFSAIMVLIGHAYTTLMYPTVKIGYTAFGIITQISVMVFFVLSGFLIGISIRENKKRNGRFLLSQYALSRARRVYPPLVAALLLVWALSEASQEIFPSGTAAFLEIPGYGAIRDGYEFSLLQSIGSLFFLNGFFTLTPSSNGPLWSLSYEVWYYIITAAAFCFRLRPAVSLALIAISVFVTMRNLEFYMLAPIWMLGFWMSTKEGEHFQRHKRAYFLWLIPITALLLYSVCYALAGEQANREEWNRNMASCKIIGGICYSIVMALILSGGIRVPMVFSPFARYSYTLYLVHFPIMLFVFGVSQQIIIGSVIYSLLVFASSVIAIIFLSSALSRIVEGTLFNREKRSPATALKEQ